MKARHSISNIMKFRLFAVFLFVTCLAFVFTPNTYAVDRLENFDYSRLWLSYAWFKYDSNLGLWDSASSDLSSFAYPTYNSETGYYEWSYSLNQPSACNNKCYMFLYNVQLTPMTYTNPFRYPNSSTTDYTHIYLFSQNNFAEGSYEKIIRWQENRFMTPMGADAWVPSAPSAHDACSSQGEATCKIKFWADSVPEYQNNDNPYNNYFYGISLDIKNTMFDEYNQTTRPYPFIRILQSPYNLSTHTFENLGSFLSWIPNNTSPFTIKFYGKVWGDDKADNGMSSESEIDLSEASPDFDLENKIINRNSNSATTSANGLNINFSVPWIFQAWFGLFVDNTCVNIPNLKSMLHSSESTVCTPWSSSLRSTLTPIFSVLSSMLAFAFVIRWLSRSSSEEVS